MTNRGCDIKCRIKYKMQYLQYNSTSCGATVDGIINVLTARQLKDLLDVRNLSTVGNRAALKNRQTVSIGQNVEIRETEIRKEEENQDNLFWTI